MKTQMINLSLTVATFLTLGTTSIQAQNLIQNGSFENFSVLKEKARWKNVTFEAWEGEGRIGTNLLGRSATNGASKLVLDGSREFNTLSQTITTVEGKTYELALDAYVARKHLNSADIQILIDDEVIATFSPTRKWAEYNATFEGTGEDQVLSIQEVDAQNNKRGAFIDNVRLTTDATVVEPSTLERQVKTSSDDAEERTAGNVSLSSTMLTDNKLEFVLPI